MSTMNPAEKLHKTADNEKSRPSDWLERSVNTKLTGIMERTTIWITIRTPIERSGISNQSLQSFESASVSSKALSPPSLWSSMCALAEVRVGEMRSFATSYPLDLGMTLAQTTRHGQQGPKSSVFGIHARKDTVHWDHVPSKQKQLLVPSLRADFRYGSSQDRWSLFPLRDRALMALLERQHGLQQPGITCKVRAPDRSCQAATSSHTTPWFSSSRTWRVSRHILLYSSYTFISGCSALPTDPTRSVDPLWKGLSLSWDLAGSTMVAVVVALAVGRLAYAVWWQTNASPPRYSDVATFTIAASFPAFLVLEPYSIKLHWFVLACWAFGLIHVVANWCFILEHPRDYFCRSCLGGFFLYAACRYYDLDDMGSWSLGMQYVAGSLCITLVLMVLPHGPRWTNQA